MRYRIYFNRQREWPQVWSIDEGSQETEVNVIGFVLRGCQVESRCLARDLPAAQREDKPSAWLEVTGRLTVKGGFAIIEADPPR